MLNENFPKSNGPVLRKQVTSPNTTHSRLMSLLGVLALTAMLVRGLVPSGYMLDASEKSGQLCEHSDLSWWRHWLLASCAGPEAGHFCYREVKFDKSVTGKKSARPHAMTAHFAPPDLAARPSPARGAPSIIWSALRGAAAWSMPWRVRRRLR